MTVTEGKVAIVKVLEELQTQGVWIRGIEIAWAVEVEPKDVPKPVTKVRATVTLQADL